MRVIVVVIVVVIVAISKRRARTLLMQENVSLQGARIVIPKQPEMRATSAGTAGKMTIDRAILTFNIVRLRNTSQDKIK